MLKRTSLNATHRAAGAQMVDFGGWEMPLNYGSQIAEHHAVRQHAGVFDVSHMAALDIAGADTLPFLRQLLANDVKKLVAQKALYSLLLNESGGVVDDLIAYLIAPDFARLILNAACAEKDIAHITQYAEKWALDVHFNRRSDLSLLALQGPKSLKIFAQSFKELDITDLKPFTCRVFPKAFIAYTGYTGEAGVECLIPNESSLHFWQTFIKNGATPCGLGARDTLRLEAGMPLYGHEMDEKTNPYEAGLGWTIDLKDEQRQFVGKTALLEKKPTFQTLGIVLKEKGVLRSGYKIETKSGEGFITSGTFSPSMQCAIALARLPLKVKTGDLVSVIIRNKKSPALVVQPPFVRNGKVLVA